MKLYGRIDHISCTWASRSPLKPWFNIIYTVNFFTVYQYRWLSEYLNSITKEWEYFKRVHTVLVEVKIQFCHEISKDPVHLNCVKDYMPKSKEENLSSKYPSGSKKHLKWWFYLECNQSFLKYVSELSYKDLLLCLLSVKETSCQYFQPRHSERTP